MRHRPFHLFHTGHRRLFAGVREVVGSVIDPATGSSVERSNMATCVGMWYFVRRSALKPRNEWTVTLDEHLVWMKRQHESGKILMSGPTPDRQYGQYLVRADSRAEAEAIAASDPFTAAGFTTYEIIEWEVHQIMGVGAFTAKGLGLPERG